MVRNAALALIATQWLTAQVPAGRRLRHPAASCLRSHWLKIACVIVAVRIHQVLLLSLEWELLTGTTITIVERLVIIGVPFQSFSTLNVTG